MEPLTIYILMMALLVVVVILVGVKSEWTTRKCHVCGAKVEVGKVSCRACGYRFSTARY